MQRGLIFLLLLFIFSACVEWYDPQIEPRESLLVVEGLLTNREGSHLIKISRSRSYNDEPGFQPESFARVFVTNEIGQRIFFEEWEPGHYYSSEQVSARVSSRYVLTIETRDGDIYESSPQTLMPQILVDSLEVSYETRETLGRDGDGEIIVTQDQGVAVYANIHGHGNSVPMIRFETVLLVQYILAEYKKGPMDDPDLFFCRVKRPLDQTVNIPLPQMGLETSSSLFHQVGFVNSTFAIQTVDTLYLRNVHRRMVILRQYTLNQDSYLFYRELKKQLESEGKLFDPVASQLRGNISCVSDPGKQALGLFEVSYFDTKTFLLSPEPLSPSNLWVRKIHDLDHLPDFEEHWEAIPDYWILY